MIIEGFIVFTTELNKVLAYSTTTSAEVNSDARPVVLTTFKSRRDLIVLRDPRPSEFLPLFGSLPAVREIPNNFSLTHRRFHQRIHRQEPSVRHAFSAKTDGFFAASFRHLPCFRKLPHPRSTR